MSGSTSNSEMVYRTLGSTGERVSALGLGGWHLSLKHVGKQPTAKSAWASARIKSI